MRGNWRGSVASKRKDFRNSGENLHWVLYFDSEGKKKGGWDLRIGSTRRGKYIFFERGVWVSQSHPSLWEENCLFHIKTRLSAFFSWSNSWVSLLPLFFPASFALLAACFCISRALFIAVSVAWCSHFFSKARRSFSRTSSLSSPTKTLTGLIKESMKS